jgi:hypothetical protein
MEVQVTGVEPASYEIATYVMVGGGWWTRPSFAQPTVSINLDGTARVSIVTDWSDLDADEIESFLIPSGSQPPLVRNGGKPALANAVASFDVTRTVASISGAVVDEQGNPIAGALVSDLVLGSTTSAADGKYSFYKIPSAGRVTLSVSYANVSFPASPTTLDISGGNQIVDFFGKATVDLPGAVSITASELATGVGTRTSTISAKPDAAIGSPMPALTLPALNGLVGFWTGNNTAADSSSVSNNGSFGGSYVPNGPGGAAAFDLSTAKVTIPNNPAYQFQGYPGWTVGFCFNTNGIAPNSSNDLFIGQDNGSGYQPKWFIDYGYTVFSSNNSFVWHVNDYNTERIFLTSQAVNPIPPGWNQLTVVVDNVGHTVTFYLNGQQIGVSGVSAYTLETTAPLIFGYAEGFYFNGWMGNVAIYNRALSAQEVLALANSTNPPPVTLQSIAVTPANPSIAKGTAQQFAATGAYSDGSTQSLTGSVTWASGTPATATITAGGLATGAGIGTSTISANLGTVTGSTVLTVTAPAYLEGDVYPFTSDAAGSFGDGTLNLLDLISMLRAITNIGPVPAVCSDRFDAMDVYPVDTTTSRGGDGKLNTLDLIEELKRVTNLDTTRPLRTPRTSCSSSTAHPEARRGGVPPGPSSGVLELVPAGDGSRRTAIFLRPSIDLDLAGLSFSVTSVGNDQLRFTASVPPSIADTGVAGSLGLAWLNGLSARAGQRLLLGYVESTSPLALHAVSANAANDGSDVILELGSLRRSAR